MFACYLTWHTSKGQTANVRLLARRRKQLIVQAIHCRCDKSLCSSFEYPSFLEYICPRVPIVLLASGFPSSVLRCPCFVFVNGHSSNDNANVRRWTVESYKGARCEDAEKASNCEPCGDTVALNGKVAEERRTKYKKYAEEGPDNKSKKQLARWLVNGAFP